MIETPPIFSPYEKPPLLQIEISAELIFKFLGSLNLRNVGTVGGTVIMSYQQQEGRIFKMNLQV